MKLIKIFPLIFIPVVSQAQTTGTTRNLGNEDITVVKEYQPVLKDAFKINISPTGDTSTTDPTPLKYSIDPKPMNSNYTISPIKPVRIKDDNIRKLYRGFVKGGYGLENTPLLDIYFNALRAKEFDAGISYHHLSSTGKITDYGFPGNSNNRLEAHGTRYFNNFQLAGEVEYDRNMVHYYGYNSPPDLFSKKETKHLMNTIRGNFGIQSAAGAETGYHGGINFYAFNDNRDTKENNIGFSGGVSHEMELGVLQADASADLMNVEQPGGIDYKRSILRFNPKLVIKKDAYSFTIGANVAFEENDGDTDYHLYPLVRGEYHVVNDLFNLWAEVSGDLQRTDIRSLANRNPFFDGFMPLANVNNKIKFQGGANIRLSHDLMLTTSGGYSRITNMPFFFNRFDTLFPVTFTTVYDDIDLITIKGALEYKRSEKYAIGVFTEYNNYATDKLDKPLYVPALRFGFNGNYAMAEKIYAKVDIYYNSKLYGIDYTENGTANTVELKGYLDANLGVDYRYNKNISVFAQLNNLGFQQYFRYFRYPSYRFIAMVGGTIAF